MTSAAHDPAPRGPTEPLPPTEELEQFVEEGSEEELHSFVLLLHPADIAELLSELDAERHWPRVLTHLDDRKLASALVELEGGDLDDLLELLPTDRLAGLLAYMESDDIADIVALVPEAISERLVATLARREPEEAEAVERLLQYEDDSAGGIMQAELCSVRNDASVGDAIAEIKRLPREDREHLHRVYIVDAEERLVGSVPLHVLVIADDARPIEEVMEAPLVSVTPEVDQEEVAGLFQKYDLVTLAVVDENGKLLGRILHDDIYDVIEEEADEDLMKMIGASEEDLVYSDRVLRISAYRLPWLVVNLLGGLVTGWLMWRFKATLGEVLALVTFIPVITGMGGNVGTQSSTILTRGFATGRVDEENISLVFLKEFLIGITMGAICGTVVAGAAVLWHGDPVLGLVVGLSMLCAMTTAATIGTLAPATFKRLHIDPAIAAGPFVTTANDITGILIYFGTATIFLEALLR